MLNTSSMALTSPLSTAQKAARTLIFKCLQRMEIGTLTVIESFQSDSQERSERFVGAHNHKPGVAISATIEVKHPAFYSRLMRGAVLLLVKPIWMVGGTVQI